MATGAGQVGEPRDVQTSRLLSTAFSKATWAKPVVWGSVAGGVAGVIALAVAAKFLCCKTAAEREEV